MCGMSAQGCVSNQPRGSKDLAVVVLVCVVCSLGRMHFYCYLSQGPTLVQHHHFDTFPSTTPHTHTAGSSGALPCPPGDWLCDLDIPQGAWLDPQGALNSVVRGAAAVLSDERCAAAAPWPSHVCHALISTADPGKLAALPLSQQVLLTPFYALRVLQHVKR